MTEVQPELIICYLGVKCNTYDNFEPYYFDADSVMYENGISKEVVLVQPGVDIPRAYQRIPRYLCDLGAKFDDAMYVQRNHSLSRPQVLPANGVALRLGFAAKKIRRSSSPQY